MVRKNWERFAYCIVVKKPVMPLRKNHNTARFVSIPHHPSYLKPLPDPSIHLSLQE